MFGVATTTLETFLSNIYGQSATAILYVLDFVWPYLMGIAVLGIFWAIGKRMFRVR